MKNILMWLYNEVFCARRTAKADLQSRTFEWHEPISKRQRAAIERLLTEKRVHVHRNPPTKKLKAVHKALFNDDGSIKPPFVGSVGGPL